MPEELPALTAVYRVVYVAAEGNQNALVFKPPVEGWTFDRVLAIDEATGATNYRGEEQEPVPHRELAEGDTRFDPEHYGHTWHYAK